MRLKEPIGQRSSSLSPLPKCTPTRCHISLQQIQQKLIREVLVKGNQTTAQLGILKWCRKKTSTWATEKEKLITVLTSKFDAARICDAAFSKSTTCRLLRRSSRPAILTWRLTMAPTRGCSKPASTFDWTVSASTQPVCGMAEWVGQGNPHEPTSIDRIAARTRRSLLRRLS